MSVRGIVERLAVLAGGLVAGLVLLEMGLRAAALVAPAMLSRATEPRDDGRVRILCVGDSHVYGAWVRPSEAFPERLEHDLTRHGVPAAVYNLGIPGENSWQVRVRLGRNLARYRPHVVLIWVGANNYWNLSERGAAPPVAHIPDLSFWHDLRIVRLVRVLRRGLREGAAAIRRPEMRVLEDFPRRGQRVLLRAFGEDDVVTMQEGSAELDAEGAARALAEDLAAMIAAVHAADAVPILVTYPAPLTPERQAVNRAVADTAARESVACVSTEEVEHRLEARRIPGLFFPDLHPGAPLYRALAWELARRLVRAGVVRKAGRPSTPYSPLVEGRCT